MSTDTSESLQGVENESMVDSEYYDAVSDNLPTTPTVKKFPGIGKSVSIDVDVVDDAPSHTSAFYHQSISFQKSAVSVQNACKFYKSEKGITTVLKDFSMTVKQGTIYSLLGASGCGKTTLLSCIVGLRKLNSGDICVLGSKPGTKASGVPGKRVGYMPQEIALFGEFSIQETLQYYGRMYSMTGSQIEENITFLITFLNLPPSYRRVSSLSGGQQRRVSFACSLIHNPELLLLDEPTVGVDALLRQSIWNHLVKLVSTGKTTVIITTHYIEEARQSNSIGLMRNGKLLVQDSPENLLKMYKTNLLEDIVMTLCLKDSAQGQNNDDILPIIELNKSEDTNISTDNLIVPQRYQRSSPIDSPPNNWRKLHRASVVSEFRPPPGKIPEQVQDSINRILTLSIKNVVVLLRNITFLCFILLVPAMQVIFVCLAIGGDPKGMKIGVVNYELPANSMCVDVKGCPLHDNYTGLVSCQYTNLIEQGTVELVFYDDEDAAIDDVKRSKLWGVLTFSCNFTQSFKERALFSNNAEIGSILASRLNFQLDVSNKQIETQLTKYFYQTSTKLMKNVSIACDIEPEKTETPLHFGTPIYGKEDTDFKEYIAPSVLLGILFFFPLSSSGLSFITEKKVGTLERSMVAGVTTAEFMFAYSIVQLLVLIIQTTFAFSFLILVFDITVNGPIILASIMALLIGVSGISAGFVLSACCTEEIQSVLLALGMFFPNLLLAGMIWPLEGMPLVLQYTAYALPCTLACETMRSVVSRGLGLYHIKVWPGFVSTLGWILFYWILFALIQKAKSRP